MKINDLKELLIDFGDDVKFEHDLKKKNWFNIGGKAKAFYKANDLKDLIKFLKKIDNNDKIFILGAGSNTLITDDLFDGIVIKLSKKFNNISLLGEDIIIAGSAVLDKSLSDFATENSLSGFEFLSCIPGTVGGGIKMNAGCFGKEFKDILLSIQAIDKLGNVITIPSKDINFEYRKNNLNEDLIFLSASLKGVKSTLSKVKNELIKESVPLDKTFGDACISNKHCNFFINKGNATFNDMKNLIEFVSKKVLEKTGISLEKEIKILE